MSTRAWIVVVGVVLLLAAEVVVLWDQVGLWAIVAAVIVAGLLGTGFVLGRTARRE